MTCEVWSAACLEADQEPIFMAALSSSASTLLTAHKLALPRSVLWVSGQSPSVVNNCRHFLTCQCPRKGDQKLQQVVRPSLLSDHFEHEDGSLLCSYSWFESYQTSSHPQRLSRGTMMMFTTSQWQFTRTFRNPTLGQLLNYQTINHRRTIRTWNICNWPKDSFHKKWALFFTYKFQLNKPHQLSARCSPEGVELGGTKCLASQFRSSPLSRIGQFGCQDSWVFPICETAFKLISLGIMRIHPMFWHVQH